MVANYSELTKLKHAKAIAKEGGCFIVERGDYDTKLYLLYREATPRNVFISKSTKVDGILKIVRRAVGST